MHIIIHHHWAASVRWLGEGMYCAVLCQIVFLQYLTRLSLHDSTAWLVSRVVWSPSGVTRGPSVVLKAVDLPCPGETTSFFSHCWLCVWLLWQDCFWRDQVVWRMPLSLPWFFIVSLCPGSFPRGWSVATGIYGYLSRTVSFWLILNLRNLKVT